jgi:hypothetical protein
MDMAHGDVLIGGAITPVTCQKSLQVSPSLPLLARKLHGRGVGAVLSNRHFMQMQAEPCVCGAVHLSCLLLVHRLNFDTWFWR